VVERRACELDLAAHRRADDLLLEAVLAVAFGLRCGAVLADRDAVPSVSSSGSRVPSSRRNSW